MFNFSVDVFVSNNDCVQAHLRRQTLEMPIGATTPVNKPDEKPFALFNAHFAGPTQQNPNGGSEALILVYDEVLCPQSILHEVAARMHGVLGEHMKKQLSGVLFLATIDRTLTATGEPPKGFAITQTATTPTSKRFILQEANESGPVGKEPSAVIDVFHPQGEKGELLSMTLLTLDSRLYGEQAARGLLGWFTQHAKIEAKPKTQVEWHNAKFLGYARPQQQGEAPTAPAPVQNA